MSRFKLGYPDKRNYVSCIGLALQGTAWLHFRVSEGLRGLGTLQNWDPYLGMVHSSHGHGFDALGWQSSGYFTNRLDPFCSWGAMCGDVSQPLNIIWYLSYMYPQQWGLPFRKAACEGLLGLPTDKVCVQGISRPVKVSEVSPSSTSCPLKFHTI